MKIEKTTTDGRKHRVYYENYIIFIIEQIENEKKKIKLLCARTVSNSSRTATVEIAISNYNTTITRNSHIYIYIQT